MPKYSTGETTLSSSGTACELCGTESSSLNDVEISGASLSVCSECSPHDDSKTASEGASGSRETTREGTGNEEEFGQRDGVTGALWDGDTTHWEKQGTGYESDQLPHLVTDYSKIVTDARKEAGLTVDEVARELGVDELSVLSVERGQAVQSEVGGSLIEDLESLLDISIINR